LVLIHLESQQQKEAEIISEILLKAASESTFRNELIKDPDMILEQYDVSPEARLIIRRSIIDLTQ
jgi:acyl-ACP thioesterase